MKNKQKVTTPSLVLCACGDIPRVVSDDGDYSQGGGYGFLFRIECKCRNATKYCKSPHRATCIWNNRQNRDQH